MTAAIGNARRRSVALRYRPPLAAEDLLAFLHARAIPGVEEVGDSTYRRSLATPHGTAVLELTPEPPDERVWLAATFDEDRALPFVERAARALFDLDADPGVIGRALGRDPVLRPLVRAHAGIRLPGAADGFELVVRAIIGQQVSVAAARTMLGRIVTRLGAPIEGEDLALFPDAGRLADAPLEELGVVGRRAGAIRRVAGMVAGGEIDLTPNADRDATTGALLEVDGIGPWTAEYVRMRALRDPDAFVAGDLGVRRSLAALGVDPSPRAIVARAESWRPWRAYATMLLWRHEME